MEWITNISMIQCNVTISTENSGLYIYKHRHVLVIEQLYFPQLYIFFVRKIWKYNSLQLSVFWTSYISINLKLLKTNIIRPIKLISIQIDQNRIKSNLLLASFGLHETIMKICSNHQSKSIASFCSCGLRREIRKTLKYSGTKIGTSMDTWLTNLLDKSQMNNGHTLRADLESCQTEANTGKRKVILGQFARPWIKVIGLEGNYLSSSTICEKKTV